VAVVAEAWRGPVVLKRRVDGIGVDVGLVLKGWVRGWLVDVVIVRWAMRGCREAAVERQRVQSWMVRGERRWRDGAIILRKCEGWIKCVYQLPMRRI
jgi:hypothetical protein